MKRIKKLWAPMLLGVLLTATVAGVANARPDARPQQQAWRVLAVPAQACIAEQELTDYLLGLNRLQCGTPICGFFCPMDFPAAGEQAVGAINVKRVTMYAQDNEATPNAVEFSLWKTYPPTKGVVGMAGGATVNSADDPQTVTDMTIVNNPIYRVQAPYMLVLIRIPPPGAMYGFFIHYTW